MLRIERFDAGELLDTLRARHYKAFKKTGTDGKHIGVVGDFNAANSVKGGRDNSDIIASIATTNRVDLESEVVLPEGGVFDYLNANRKIYADHEYDIPHLVGGLRGKGLVPWPDAKNQRGWQMTVGVLRNYEFPTAGAVLQIAREIGIGASIAFERLEGGPPTPEERKRYPGATSIVRKWHAIEVSFTCLPCNVECQSFAATVDKSYVPAAVRALSLLDPKVFDISEAASLLHLVEAKVFDKPRPAFSLVDN